jgi:hypothetical protein
VLTRDPSEPLAVGGVIAAVSVLVACVAALTAIAIDERFAAVARPRGRAPRQARALRRGLELGVLVAALGLLRAVDALTVITGGFVVAGFVLAELVWSARPAAHSR